MEPLWIVGGCVLLLLIVLAVVAGMYNTLVELKNYVREAWAQIDVQLRRRYDLIPNLVATVKGYATHERETLEAVIRARDGAGQALLQLARSAPGGIPGGANAAPSLTGASRPTGLGSLSQAEGMLTAALSRMMITVERYPELKANENFRQLQDELVGTETRIANTRKRYNEVVRRYMTKKESFPENIIAGMFRFPNADFFDEPDQAVRQAPKVSFS